MQKKRGFGAGR